MNNVSVVLAAYNGEKYIEDQINSIVGQLSEGDELIISDDGSTDETMFIVQRLEKRYPCIRVVKGPKKGYIYNFEYLLKLAMNEIIMFSDQDDIWESDKINKVKDVFLNNPKCWVILHNASFIDGEGKILGGTIFQERKARYGFVHNLIKSSYYGCCMAISRDYLDMILPFPMREVCYDQWIGLFAEKKRRTVLVEDCLLKHRIHGSNQSQKRAFWYRVKFRIMLLKYMKELNRRFNSKVL